jgi:50S ribosomal protein L16 3-hydroxylase
MNIQQLFGEVPVATFIAENLHRLPFALAGSAKCVAELGTWEALGKILAVADGDVSAVRGGEWHDGPAPQDRDSARALCTQGYTVFIRHAERHLAGLAELAEAFEATFLGPVNIHVFATPPGAPGFSWHYDAEDVFILQTAGEKEYSLRKNTVNPWPLEDTLPTDMRYERELMPLMRVLLRAGDLLYIPCGYWHKAEAKGAPYAGVVYTQEEISPNFLGTENGDRPRSGKSGQSQQPKTGTEPSDVAISLAVGVMSRSALDVYDFLRSRLVQSLVWRQRLPVPEAGEGSQEELMPTYRHLFDQLAADLARTFADPQLIVDFLAQLPNRPAQQPAAGGEEK